MGGGGGGEGEQNPDCRKFCRTEFPVLSTNKFQGEKKGVGVGWGWGGWSID